MCRSDYAAIVWKVQNGCEDVCRHASGVVFDGRRLFLHGPVRVLFLVRDGGNRSRYTLPRSERGSAMKFFGSSTHGEKNWREVSDTLRQFLR